MALVPGSRLGPYEIVAPIGAGGMGEVYRARDTRLDRTVAVKVLSGALADRPDLRQRFEREARAVSSLNHPHICALYDVGQQDGVDFLVMEYIEGETVAARVEKGPLPLATALRCAVQVADALDQAHRRGFAHRDLKPANVMLTQSGAKLLDFGLARTAAGQEPEGAVALTLTRDLTQEGSIIGTIPYMSPEQLEGRPADARSDIFAFGAVLYEMLTGRRAFTGNSPASVIAAILSTEPQPVSIAQPAIPAALDRVVRRCLAKDPEQRWQSARDLMLELEWIAQSPAERAAGSRPRAARAWWLAMAALVVVAAAGWVLAYVGRSSPPARYEFAVGPPNSGTFAFGTNTGGSAISPDGQTLAFVAAVDGKAMLWVRPLHSVLAKPLPGTDGAYYPFWSPDNRFLAFFASGKLKRVEAAPGSGAATPQIVCDAPEARGGSWGRDNIIVLTPVGAGRIHRVAATGGEPTPVFGPDSDSQYMAQMWPHFLPDGRHFLYFARAPQRENSSIRVGSLDSSSAGPAIVQASSNAAYVPPQAGRPGYLLFLRGRTLVAQVFDVRSLKVEGPALPVAENVGYLGNLQVGDFSASSHGVLTYGGIGFVDTQLVWYGRDGKRLGVAGKPGAYVSIRLSPDEKAAAVWQDTSDNQDIWIIEFARGVSSRLTSDPGVDVMPVWSPDGTQIAFASARGSRPNLYVQQVSGSGQTERLVPPGPTNIPGDWSRDGRWLLYFNLNAKTNWDLWALPMIGDRKPVPFLQSEFNESDGRFSPSAEWVAYTSDEPGRNEVYVCRFPSGANRVQISTEGGAQPFWRQDGRELFYMAPDGTLMAVDVRAGASFEAGAPRPLFQTRTPQTGRSVHYQPSGDGQRFLVNTLLSESASAPMTVIVNWAPAQR